jgi:hypothetical protein
MASTFSVIVTFRKRNYEKLREKGTKFIANTEKSTLMMQTEKISEFWFFNSALTMIFTPGNFHSEYQNLI